MIDQLVPTRIFAFAATVLLAIQLPCLTRVSGEEPTLSHRIDATIASTYIGPEIPLSDHFEFQRRIYLDLIGRGPTIEETQNFLSQLASSPDASTVVREQLIDELLSREEFSRYYAKVLEVMFTERREVISPLLFRALIRQWLEERRPLNELCTEILASDGTGEQLKAAASFIVNRNAEPNLVTRDIGRIFFGRDVQCAQCHDHPLVADYEQAEYFGILSFVNRTYLFQDEKRGGAFFLGEKGEGTLEFSSVFRPQDDKSTAQPVLPAEMAMDAEPDFIDGVDAYIVAPDKDKRAIPRYSRRQQLAVLATHRENEAFNRNMANRLWANMMGRGIVHPVDMHHTDNPPVSASLLRVLSEHFVASDYDLREFLRQIARSNAYQRSVLAPALDSWPGPSGGVAELESQVATINQALEQIDSKIVILNAEIEAAMAQGERARTDVNKLQEQCDEAKKQLQQLIDQRDKDVAEFKELQNKQAKQDELVQSLQKAFDEVEKVLLITPEDHELVASRASLEARLTAAKESKLALYNQVAEFSEEVVDKANYRVEDGRSRVLALSNRQFALGEFVVEARGVQRRLRHQMQELLDQQSDCRQQKSRIAALQNWLLQRETTLASIAGGRAEEGAIQQKQLESQQADLLESWRHSFALRRIRALSAEQMTGAIYTALSMHHAVREKAMAEWEAMHKENPVELGDFKKRQAFVNAAIANNMWDTVEDLAIARFALPAGSPQDGFFATVDQALTIQNDPTFLNWLKSSSGNLLEHLSTINDSDQFVDQLYLNILCRRPDDQERKMVAQLLTCHSQERQSIVQELVWGLIASAEFRFML